MGRIKQGRDHSVASLNIGRPTDGMCNSDRISSLKQAVRAEVEIYADVGESQQRTGSERDGPVFIVGIEARLGSLLPA